MKVQYNRIYALICIRKGNYFIVVCGQNLYFGGLAYETLLTSLDFPYILAVICGEPPAISNATVDVEKNTFGGSASYRCDDGFQAATAGGVVTCGQNGQWSITSFHCQRECLPV